MMQFISRYVFWGWLTQHLETLESPDRVFTNSDVSTNFADALVLQPDTCHPPLVIEIPLAFHNYNPTPNYKYFLL